LALAGVHKPRFVVPALAGAAAVVVIAWLTDLIPSSLQQRILHAFRLDDLAVTGPVTSQNFSTMERFAHWVAGLRMFAAHPILGVGAGNYDAAYARYVVDLSTWPEPLGHAHNYYINAAAETGILGLLAFLALTGVVLDAAWRLVRDSSSGKRDGIARAAGRPLAGRAAAVGLFAVIVAFTVHNATDDLFVHSMELQFALYLAILLARQPHAADAT
jgi:O-antigen ligase